MAKSYMYLTALISIQLFFPQVQAEYLPDITTPEEIATELQLPPVQEVTHQGLITRETTQKILSGQVELDPTLFPDYPIIIVVNKAATGPTAQTAKLYENGALTHEFLVSTGREQQEVAKSGKEYFTATPVGFFRPTRMVKNHWSVTWQAPMPNAIFFTGGIAFHATTENYYPKLGTRASGGCVRLTMTDSEILFKLVETYGMDMIPNINVYGEKTLKKDGSFAMANNWRTLIVVIDNPN